MELGGGCGRNTGTNTMIVFIFILMTIRRHNFRFVARAYLFVSSQCQYFVCVLRYVDSYAILNVALVGGMTTKWMSSADGKTWPTTIDDERGPPGQNWVKEMHGKRKEERERERNGSYTRQTDQFTVCASQSIIKSSTFIMSTLPMITIRLSNTKMKLCFVRRNGTARREN